MLLFCNYGLVKLCLRWDYFGALSCSVYTSLCLSWFASLGKILTTDNLHKRRVIVLDWCYMCKRCEKSVDHLLLHYSIAWELWSLVFCFEGCERSLLKIKSFFLHTLFEWSVVFSHFSCSSFSFFLDRCSFVS